MRQGMTENRQEQLITNLSRLWKDQQDRILIVKTIQALDTRYGLDRKLATSLGSKELSSKWLEGWQGPMVD